MRESDKIILQAIETLSPRMRLVARGVGLGKSYSEIGAELGISKQAAHKLAAAVIITLREKLETMGFSGVDTIGLLKSCSLPGIPRRMVDVFPPQP
jgi:DNA-directed RNA polymerase specialized sigma24 family protein